MAGRNHEKVPEVPEKALLGVRPTRRAEEAVDDGDIVMPQRLAMTDEEEDGHRQPAQYDNVYRPFHRDQPQHVAIPQGATRKGT